MISSLPDQILKLLGISDVADDSQNLSSFLAADFSSFLQFGLSSRADGQIRAFFCETNRRFPADTAAAAGD